MPNATERKGAGSGKGAGYGVDLGGGRVLFIAASLVSFMASMACLMTMGPF
eukprot:COSAG06_NODE_53660_length_299_cov_0.355000_1_plen_50_part_01